MNIIPGRFFGPALCLALFGAHISTANALPIFSPVGATATSENGAAYDIGNTIDQSGLSSGFVSGVTDFDAYLATNPTHTLIADNNEWFTPFGVTSATVVYDMGSALVLNGLALWNEEFSGFGVGDIFTSLDNITFDFLTTINPVASAFGSDYGAQQFSLFDVTARYIRFDISGCPQPGGDASLLCGIGEVAFAVGTAAEPVPAPATLALFGLGLAGLGWSRRKKA